MGLLKQPGTVKSSNEHARVTFFNCYLFFRKCFRNRSRKNKISEAGKKGRKWKMYASHKKKKKKKKWSASIIAGLSAPHPPPPLSTNTPSPPFSNHPRTHTQKKANPVSQTPHFLPKRPKKNYKTRTHSLSPQVRKQEHRAKEHTPKQWTHQNKK